MNDVTISNGIKELSIFEQWNDAWVTSRTIAKMFDKEHSKIIRSIDNILADKDDFTEANFGLSEYKDKSGKKNKEYLLNRKSFVLVVMGFTGKKAMQFKKAYIEAFDSMQHLIQTRLLSKDGYKLMTDAIKSYMPIFAEMPNHKEWMIYAKEANMINQIVLGMSSKEFREVNECDTVRDNLVENKLIKLNEAQTLNAQLIKANQDFYKREEIIKALFNE